MRAGLPLLMGVGVFLAAACAPPVQRSSSESSGGLPASQPKLLHLGSLSADEPKDFGLAFGTISAGSSEPRFMIHAPLTVYDEKGTLTPRLVERIPTVANGDWKILPDGKMDVTWKLREEGVRWHDGTPFEAGDVVLGYKIATDPRLALATAALRHPQAARRSER